MHQGSHCGLGAPEGMESAVWVRTTARKHESESAQPSQRWWLQKGREASEDWRMVPRQSQRQVPTHPMDSLPQKSCPNLGDDTPGDDTQTSQPQTLKHEQSKIPIAQRGKLRPREGQGPT